MRVKRIFWHKPPTQEFLVWLASGFMFGPSVFSKGNEWLLIMSDDPLFHADTPDGYELLDLMAMAWPELVNVTRA